MPGKRSQKSRAEDRLRPHLRDAIDRLEIRSLLGLTPPLYVDVSGDKAIRLGPQLRVQLEEIVQRAQREGKLPARLEHFERPMLAGDELLSVAFKEVESALGHYLGVKRMMEAWPRAEVHTYVRDLSDCAERLFYDLTLFEEMFGANGESVPHHVSVTISLAGLRAQFLSEDQASELPDDPWSVKRWPNARPPLKELADWIWDVRMRLEPLLYALEQKGRGRGTALAALLSRLGGVWCCMLGGARVRPTISPPRNGGRGGPFLHFVETALQALPDKERLQPGTIDSPVEEFCRQVKKLPSIEIISFTVWD